MKHFNFSFPLLKFINFAETEYFILTLVQSRDILFLNDNILIDNARKDDDLSDILQFSNTLFI